MSKVSSNYPSYSNSSVSVGGSTANTGVTNGTLTSDYDMSDSESAIYNYALNAIANILPNINTFDTGTQSNLQSELDAYKDSGISDINDLYNSSLTNLENDAASRFGNLDNSIFSDNLDNLESERSNAVSSFAQDVLSKQSSLESDELTQRYALVEMLSGLADNTYDNALNAISTALSGSSSANDYNSTEMSNAIAALKNTSTSSSSSSSLSSLLSSLLGSSTGTTSSLSSLLSNL